MNMNKNILFVILLLIGGQAYANPFAADTLQRELVLQQDYAPVGQQAQKEFFNPLDTRGQKALKPIEFARNTYQVGMNVHPLLFNPLHNPLAPDDHKQTFYGRFFGGYPGHAGVNAGVVAKTGERGSLLISVDHLSRFVDGIQGELPFVPMDQTHDTEVALGYTHALDARVLNVGIDLFHHSNTFYGINMELPTGTQFDDTNEFDPVLYNLLGTEVSFSLSPAPLSLVRGWQYNASGKLGFTSKDDIGQGYATNPVVMLNGAAADKNSLSELSVDLKGNIGYKFAGTDWGFGADANYQMLSIGALGVYPEVSAVYEGRNEMKPMQLLSLDPYLEYNKPNMLIKAGAKVQLLNRGAKTILITPDVQLRFKATPMFSIYANVDGGAEYFGLRENYLQNRWAEAVSVYTGYHIAQFRALLGIQVGNYNGFSLDINGGYAQYSDFSDWRFHELSGEYTPYLINTYSFIRKNRGRAGHTFVNATAGYVSPMGLDLRAKIQYNSYASLEESKLPIGYGLPMTELYLSADYQATEKLVFNVNFSGMGGIKFKEADLIPTDTAADIELPFITELGARITYKAHKNIGVSLIGNNLLNKRSERWLGYYRQGATVQGAVIITF